MFPFPIEGCFVSIQHRLTWVLCNIWSLQNGGNRVLKPSNQITKNFSPRSKSKGGSCDRALYSRTYMLRYVDLSSACIDYSKGDVEDSVVDSPLSRRPDSRLLLISVETNIVEYREFLLP